MNKYTMSNDNLAIYSEWTKHFEHCPFHDIDWPGESYDPLLMSPVKSTSISVDEGE